MVTDPRGRRVWKWITRTLDSTSTLLRRLQNRDLTLEQTAPGKKLLALSIDEQAGLRTSSNDGGGFDPYDHRSAKTKPLWSC